MNYYIGIDLGTSSCKGVITDKLGNVYASHSVRYKVSCPRPGFSEQDPSDWLSAAVKILSVLSSGREDEVRGISIAGQMHGLVMLDENDEVIRPAILWNDGRSEKQTRYLNSLKETFEETGNIAFPGFTAPKILWVRENEPDNFRRCRKICLPKDYLAYMLTGVFSTDYSDASGMLLLDVENKKWSSKMCDICGISVKMLPDLYESYQITGKVKDVFGLRNAYMCAGAGDNAASAIGTGTVSEGDCSISLGTSGTVFLPCDNFKKGFGDRLHNFCHANGKYHLMGCILSAASCDEWWTKEILKTDFDKFTFDKAGKTGLFFLPYLSGERCPHNDPTVRGAFFGLSQNTSREDMCLAVYEGVAYALRDSIETGGVSVKSAVLCGGGAKSPLWQSVISNVLNADIFITEKEQFGGAILAMTGCGEYDNIQDAIAATVRKIPAKTPDRHIAEKYDEGFKIYKKLYPAIRDLIPQDTGL